ncbi:MAG: hypothetical protein LBH29_06065 [Elusimicrobiota bacterium]|jgi:hypothetical protein|nr:hypothetical protein [Elusimicrobiota bacterium]
MLVRPKLLDNPYVYTDDSEEPDPIYFGYRLKKEAPQAVKQEFDEFIRDLQAHARAGFNF